MSLRIPITKGKLHQLAEQLELLRMGFDLLDDHAVITDSNANIIYANRAAEKNTGFSYAEMIGKNPGDLWGAHMPKEFYEKMWQTIKIEKKPFVGEVQNKRKDGTMYWQEVHISPILNAGGEVEFFIAIEPNITERKERDKFREEFVSILGHQLRNPLTAIAWLVEALFKSSNLTDSDKKKLEDIYRQDKGLSDFVSDLLVLSVANKTDLKKEQIDLESEIKAIIREVSLKNPKVNFSFHSQGENFTLSSNRSMAIQVFANLIYNAAEYSDPKAGQVDILLEKQDSAYLFSCHNNGLEILEEDRPKIFSMLFRSDKAVETKKSGTGLGLFIAKTICDNCGWKVWFESTANQGVTFFVRIPQK